jgi:hypothetical protein
MNLENIPWNFSARAENMQKTIQLNQGSHYTTNERLISPSGFLSRAHDDLVVRGSDTAQV